MEFAWNTQKNKFSDVKGKEIEQERKSDNLKNDDINKSKTHLNYDLIQSDLNLYQRVKNRVDDVRKNSRIQKNSVVMYSNVITVNQNDFQEWGIEKTKSYFECVTKFFQNEFGKENVVSAKIHLDETTPHMHLHFVPVSEEGKLQARKVMTPKRINDIHTNAPKFLKEYGFNVTRGDGKTKKDGNVNDIYEFKKKKEKELENKIEILTKRLNNLLCVSEVIENISSIETKKKFLGGKISIKESDYKKIVSLAKNLLIENDKLQENNNALEKENDLLIGKLNKANTKIENFNYRAIDFNKRKEELRDELFDDYKLTVVRNVKLDLENIELKKKNKELETYNSEIKKAFLDLKEFAIEKGLLKREVGLRR